MNCKLFIASFLLGCAIPAIPQEDIRFNRDISEILSVNGFERIVQFILDNGGRETYSSMYNHNPHYKLENFDIYLNPISQWLNLTEEHLSFLVSDYDVIVIHDRNNSPAYYSIRLYNGKVWIYNTDRVEHINYENELLTKYIPKLKLLLD